jgi:hypothetical protein
MTFKYSLNSLQHSSICNGGLVSSWWFCMGVSSLDIMTFTFLVISLCNHRWRLMLNRIQWEWSESQWKRFGYAVWMGTPKSIHTESVSVEWFRSDLHVGENTAYTRLMTAMPSTFKSTDKMSPWNYWICEAWNFLTSTFVSQLIVLWKKPV